MNEKGRREGKVGKFAEREKKKSSSFFWDGTDEKSDAKGSQPLLILLLVDFAMSSVRGDGRIREESSRGRKERERNSKEKEGLYVSQRRD